MADQIQPLLAQNEFSVIDSLSNENENSPQCRETVAEPLIISSDPLAQREIFTFNGHLRRFGLERASSSSFNGNQIPPPQDEAQIAAANLQKTQQAQQEWLDTLRTSAPDAKVFNFPLTRGLVERGESFYSRTYTEASSILGTGKQSGLDRYLQPQYQTLEAMGRIANLQTSQITNPASVRNWTLMNEDQRLASQILELSKKYPPGTKFALVATNGSGIAWTSAPYNPPPLYSSYNLDIAVTTQNLDGTTKTEVFSPGLDGVPPRPGFYSSDYSNDRITASVDVTHLVTGVRPREAQATINIGAADSLTDKNSNFIERNYDKFVNASFAKYLYLRGDEPRELSGASLVNEIGMAMKIRPNNVPQTDADRTALNNGTWEFYTGAERARIAKVEQLVRNVGGDSSAQVTVLPVMLNANLPVGSEIKKAIIEVPLFRVQGGDGKEYFVDDGERVYSSFEDWKANNQLPAGRMTYPTDGHLTADSNGRVRVETSNTPNVVDTTWERIQPYLDGAALVGGVIVAGLVIAGTGGTALLVAGVAVGAYGAGRSGTTLYDRYSHGQTLSLADPQARSEWIGLGANVIGIAALGATARAVNLANKGVAVSNGTLRTVNALNVANQYADTIAVANTGHFLASNWDNLSAADKMFAVGQMAFWGGTFAHSYKQAGGLRNLYGAEPIVKYVEQSNLRIAQETRISNLSRTTGSADIKQTSDGLLHINNQLTVHPSRLAEISDADLGDLLRITRQIESAGGNEAALKSLSKDDQSRLNIIKRDYNFRLEYQRKSADDLIHDLGLSGEPMFRDLTNAERTRISQAVVGEPLPRTDPLRLDGKQGVSDLQQQAANWAMRGAKDANEFANRYQFYVAQFKRVYAERVASRDARINQEIEEWQQKNPDLIGTKTADKIKSQIISRLDKEIGTKPQISAALVRELGTESNISMPGEKTKQLISAVYEQESRFWQGRIGESRLILYPSDRVYLMNQSTLEGKTRQISDRLSFGTEAAAIYHTRKHFPEISGSNEVIKNKNNQILEAESYLMSARRTVREGNLISSSRNVSDESRTLIFERQLNDGTKIRAYVEVRDGGEAKLLTYFKNDK